MQILRTLIPIYFAMTFVTYSHAHAAEIPCCPSPPGAVHSIDERQNTRNKALEASPCLTMDAIVQRKSIRLKELAENARLQRQSTEDFQAFFSWMSANLAGYNKYIQAGSYAAVFAKALPIPYAGQASVFAKFAAQFTIALNNASTAISSYRATSQKFIDMCDEIARSPELNQQKLSEAASFADTKLLHDMNEVHSRLGTVAELSSGTLSFLETLNHYVSGSDEYWNRVKGVFKKDIDPKEKSFLSENIQSMKNQATRYNTRLKTFDELSAKQNATVKSLSTYDELIELLASTTKNQLIPQ